MDGGIHFYIQVELPQLRNLNYTKMTMKIKYYIYFCLLVPAGLLWFPACAELDINESSYHSDEYMFSDFPRAKQSLNYVYSYLQDGLSAVGGTMRDCAGDDAVYAWAEDPVSTFYDGSWAANRTVDDQWSHYYEGIRSANWFIANCPDDFPYAEYVIDYASMKKELQMYPNEARALRAYYHFELLKRYGHIVIADRVFGPDEVNGLVPVSYSEAVEWIAGECDACAKVLPDTWKDTYTNESGRVTRGFVMALKARLLLYAASPLNSPEGDTGAWAKAASAALDVIDLPYFALADEDDVNNGNALGLIFGINRDASNSFERANMPVGYEGGNSGVCPSLNLMEAFDMRDGSMFSWTENAEDALDLSKRDPRMARTILVNGSVFKGQEIETWYGGRNGLPQDGASPTSFYLRKFIQENTRLTSGDESSYSHLYPIFRLTEMYLDYAEALYYATGDPGFTGSIGGTDYSMSPLDALNAVRARVNMPPVTVSSGAEFVERLRRERRVELAFEDHRFWDIRRWGIGAAAKDVYGLSVTLGDDGAVTLERKLVRSGFWDERMNMYPVPDTERHNNPNLVQNTGW